MDEKAGRSVADGSSWGAGFPVGLTARRGNRERAGEDLIPDREQSEPAGDFQQLDSQGSQTPLPQRLAIIHLLGWTALVGFVLALRQDHLAGADPSAGISVTYFGYELIYALVVGAGLLSLCIAARRWGEGLSFPQEPGEWMLFAYGLSFLWSALLVPAILHLLSPLSPDEQRWLQPAITYALILPLWTWPLIRLRHSPFRWYFMVRLISSLCSLVLFAAMTFGEYYPEGGVLLYSFGIIERFGPLLTLLYGLWRDDQPGQRGWLHLFGLGITLMGAAATLGLQIWYFVRMYTQSG